MSEETLLPCPFCGGEAKLDVDQHGQHSVWHAGACIRAELNHAITGITEAESLVAAWNRRTPDPLARLAVADALRKIEWSARDRYPDEDEEFRACPCCGSHELAGHTNDCLLATAIADARSSPPAALREAELDRLAREVAEAQIEEAAAGKALFAAERRTVQDKSREAFAELREAVSRSTKAFEESKAALAAYRAAKEGTAP